MKHPRPDKSYHPIKVGDQFESARKGTLQPRIRVERLDGMWTRVTRVYLVRGEWRDGRSTNVMTHRLQGRLGWNPVVGQ